MTALPDAERRVAEYSGIVRREYLPMGIRVALRPMADVFSEPRRSRGFGAFGEDPETVARLTAAFLTSLRGGPDAADRSAPTVPHSTHLRHLTPYYRSQRRVSISTARTHIPLL